METLVVIPYLASAAQGNELRLAVEGWRQHFKEPYQLVIVGDCPDWLKGAKTREVGDLKLEVVVDPEFDYGIRFINCPRIEPVPGEYTPCLDHVHKFRQVRKAFPNHKGFIYACDDMYAVSDFTLEDVKAPKYPEIATEDFSWNGKSEDWWDVRGKMADICKKEGLPVRDWVCHLPVYYEWDKLLDIFDKYDADHKSIIPENIYFNLYSSARGAADAREYRDEVKGSYPNIRPIGTVKWITNQNCGWSKKLETILKEHYGI